MGRKAELFLLSLLSLGFLMAGLGIILYVNKIFARYGVGCELQLATIGFFIVLFTFGFMSFFVEGVRMEDWEKEWVKSMREKCRKLTPFLGKDFMDLLFGGGL